jgi:pyrroloquinoline quinone biosynthesis protein B
VRLTVLGAAAGGGFPQWNCCCDNCAAARNGESDAVPRTQDALAASADGDAWVLINASPDLTAQVKNTKALHPRGGRATPIRAVVLTNGDLDHVLGLFSLRESSPLEIFATDTVRRGLERNAMLRTLQRFDGQLTWRRLELDRKIDVFGMTLTPFTLPGKAPKHLEGVEAPTDEDSIGLEIEANGARAVVASSFGRGDAAWLSRAENADALIADGTFWESDELIRLGLGTARAEDMAHWPVGGSDGSLAVLAKSNAKRKIFGHINNTNPMLRDGSSERAAVLRAGFEVAVDGREVLG